MRPVRRETALSWAGEARRCSRGLRLVTTRGPGLASREQASKEKRVAEREREKDGVVKRKSCRYKTTEREGAYEYRDEEEKEENGE
jgi:hypothetical protein